MQNVGDSVEAKELSKICGSLSQLVRVGPQKVWRKQYTALATSSNGKGLSVYFFTEGGGTSVLPTFMKKSSSVTKSGDEEKPISLKLKSELELEQGCEARAMSPVDAPGGKENCFMLITSKNQLKFQAASSDDRTRWVDALTSEFEREMELTLIEQKARMLRKGAVLSWHRPQKHGGMTSVKVCIDDAGFITVGDLPAVPLSDVETVLAGNESDELRLLGDHIFHFNCFVIKLKQATDSFYPGCGSLDFEAPKQSTRDDWVSALEARLKEEGVYFNPNEVPITRAASSSRALSMATKEHPKLAVPASPQKASILSSTAPAALFESSANKPGRGQSVATNANGGTKTLEENPALTAVSRLKKHASSSAKAIVGDSASAAQEGANANKGRTMTLSLGEDDDDDDGEQAKGATGVGEYFKQKVKLGADFPYSKCVCFALETSLLGDRAGNILTPDREISPAEMDEVTHHPKLEIPPSADDIKKAAQARKKLKRVIYDMTEYAPGAFKELRNRWGITDLAYFKSVSQLSGDGAVGDGKSGMLFFFTRDRRYVLKTVKTNEMAVLVEKGLLKAYIKHMADNPDSLVCRFFGLYTFKMGKPAKDITLVCMQNSFDTRLVLHEKYDLKGSTRNRWCTPRFGSVLKDLNFGNTKLYMDTKDRVDFLKQCERDTALFEQFNVMDYSLLLGIHKPAENPDKVKRNLLLLSMANQLEQRSSASGTPTANKLRQNSVSGAPPKAFTSAHPYATRWQRDFGGVEGVNPETNAPQVYIMQIIDILQAYDVGKKAENFIKSQITEEVNEISSVNPKTYRTRFLAYMAKIIVGVDGQNVSLHAARRDLRMKMFSSALLDGVGNGGSTQDASKKIVKPQLAAVEEERVHDVAPVQLGTVPVVQAPPKQPPPVPPKRPSMTPVSVIAVPPPIPTKRSASMTPSIASSVADARARESSFAQALREEEDVVDLKNEPQLKAEIAAAVAEAEKEKLADAGGAFTEVLEDGTEIDILEDGGFIQRMTNGIVIRKFPDGATRQTNPDGSTIDVSASGVMTCHLPDGTEIVHVSEANTDVMDIQKNPDGSSIEIRHDGSTVQRNVDGSRIEIAVNGDKRTIFADGTVIEQLTGGATRQVNPDGLTIVSLTDGSRVQTDAKLPHIVLTLYPDGSTIQEDKADGITIKRDKDGTEFHEFPDGSKITIHPDGRSVQTNLDGSTIETDLDGKKTLRNREGKIVDLL